MRTYQKIARLLGDLLTIAEQFHYPSSSICVLKGNETELYKAYPETYKNLMTCSHHSDKRKMMDYGKDLVASWIMEDSVQQKLKETGLMINKAGADRERIVLPNSKVSSSSDYDVFYQGIKRKLELLCDYSDYWKREKRCHLRDKKYPRACKTHSIVLGIAKDSYLLINDISMYQHKYIESHPPYGDKPAEEITLTDADLSEPLDYGTITRRINEMIVKQGTR